MASPAAVTRRGVLRHQQSPLAPACSRTGTSLSRARAPRRNPFTGSHRLVTTQRGDDSTALKPDEVPSSSAATTTATTTSLSSGGRRERVVILGSGWAGYALARDLDPAKYERIVISPRSYFVFTPLLASTSVGTLEFRSVLEPVRRLQPDRFHQGWADGVDFGRKTVRVETNPDADELTSRTLPPVVSSSRDGAASSSSPSSPPANDQDPLNTAPDTDTDTVTVSASPHASQTITHRRGPLIDVPYDKLILAVGAYSQTFGIPGVREHAHFLRDVGDARAIRTRVLQCFERADQPGVTDAQRRGLLHFAVVGGGPTGVEFAAELHDLVHDDLRRTYPRLAPLVSITVYDIAPKVLPMFDKKLSAYAINLFKRQGINVATEHHLQEIRVDEGGGAGGLKLRIKEYGDEEVDAGMVVWSTGLMQNPLVGKLLRQEIRGGKGDDDAAGTTKIAQDAKSGGIITDDHLRVRLQHPSAQDTKDGVSSSSPATILPDVFAIGDCSVMERETLPATAQVAAQQAKYLANALNKHGRPVDQGEAASGDALDAARPFRFRNLGTLAYLGSWRAILQSDATPNGLSGRLAWVLWRGAYVTRSMSVRNKIMVIVHWVMTWLFGRDISRF